MNHHILSIDVQAFLKENEKSQPTKIALSKSKFSEVSPSELAEQVDSRQRLSTKLPSWLTGENIFFPPRRNAEQCSSEATANYKAQLVKGKSAIDLTGGFGVDAHAFSQNFDSVEYCEMDEILFPIVRHNLEQLKCNNVNCHFGNSLDLLKKNNKSYDLIYLDPHRRDEHNRKMVGFADCVPNVVELQDFLFERSPIIMVKASPMMDITRAIDELECVKEVHVVALKNECKELLFILEKGYKEEAKILAINLNKEETSTFSFLRSDEQDSFAPLGEIDKYIYEPNTAILKSGAFNSLATPYALKKLHASTHLYTSHLVNDTFPGKGYEVLHILDYNKNQINKALENKQINIKTYNFSNTPQQVQKKLGLKDGGKLFLFGVKDKNEKYRIIIAEKI